MIKRCTNKKCGKKFEVPNNKNASCPYCGTVHLWTSKKIKTYSLILGPGGSSLFLDTKSFIAKFLRDLCGFSIPRANREEKYIEQGHTVILKKNLSFEEAVKYRRSLRCRSKFYDYVNITLVKEPLPIWIGHEDRDLSQDVCWNEKSK